MRRTVRSVAVALVVITTAIQFVRPARTNPLVDPSHALAELQPVPAHVTAVLDRACRDCHSNETSWPWYTNISPVSWFVADHVHHGRDHFNYSEWTSYDSDDQDKFLGAMCDLAKRERMPLPSYLLIHRASKLSSEDVTALCTWSDKMRDTLQ